MIKKNFMNEMKINNDMNDKELLLKAIDNYSLYTSAQRVLLRTFVSINVNNIIITDVKELSKMLGISKATIYSSLEIFLIGGVIERVKSPNKGIGMLKLISSQLEEIKNIFLKKHELLKNY